MDYPFKPLIRYKVIISCSKQTLRPWITLTPTGTESKHAEQYQKTQAQCSRANQNAGMPRRRIVAHAHLMLTFRHAYRAEGKIGAVDQRGLPVQRRPPARIVGVCHDEVSSAGRHRYSD